MCVYIESLHVHLGGGVTHVGKFHYWAIAHPVEGILFHVRGAIGKATLIRDRFEKKAGLWLCYLFVKHVLHMFVLRV